MLPAGRFASFDGIADGGPHAGTRRRPETPCHGVRRVTEIWKPVVGYEGDYEVSDKGRVRSLTRKVRCRGGKFRLKRGRVMSPSIDQKTGYQSVCLAFEGAVKTFRVHVLVAAAFIGPRPNGQDVCHGPLGKAIHHASNLSYGTREKNCADRLRDGTHLEGEDIAQSKLTVEDVLDVRRRCTRRGMKRKMARKLKVTESLVSMIVNRRIWKHI